jgi:hypothetical protein
MRIYGVDFLTLVLDEKEWSVSRVGRSTPGVISPVPIGYEAVRNLGPSWTLWRK